MKVVNRYVNVKQRESNYKIINLSDVMNINNVGQCCTTEIHENSKETKNTTIIRTGHIQPKFESKCERKQIDYGDDEEYNLICKTQECVKQLLSDKGMTLGKMEVELITKIDNDHLNIHEIITVLANYSLWEIMGKIIKNYDIKKVSHNNHKFNILHKSIMPSWLWHYRQPVDEMPVNMKRKTNDIFMTLKFLLDNNMVCSILEPTPRVISGKGNGYENSIVLLNQILPRELIVDIHEKTYNLMTLELSKERILVELAYIIPKMRDYEYMRRHNSNEIKWICSHSPELFLQHFFEYYKDRTMEDNYDYVRKILNTPTISDNIFDGYFAKNPWSYNSKLFDEIVMKIMLHIEI